MEKCVLSLSWRLERAPKTLLRQRALAQWAQSHPGLAAHASSWLPRRSSVGHMELDELLGQSRVRTAKQHSFGDQPFRSAGLRYPISTKKQFYISPSSCCCVFSYK